MIQEHAWVNPILGALMLIIAGVVIAGTVWALIIIYRLLYASISILLDNNKYKKECNS